MTGMRKTTDMWLLAQVVVLDYMTAARDAMTRTARRLTADETGQTPTEYLMIVGLMAAVILLAFVTFFWDTIKGAVQAWAGKSSDAIQGTPIQ
jgi:Flp pilus assembly pilin Flp